MRGKRRSGRRRWAVPTGQKGRGGGNEPWMVFHLCNAFLFLLPEFLTKYQRGISNPKMISKDSYHHKFNKQKQTISHMQLDFSTVIFIHVKVIFIHVKNNSSWLI
jgi:hypothetical protein